MMLEFPSSGSGRLGLRPFAMSESQLRARRQRVAAQHLDPANGVLASQPAECHRRLGTKTCPVQVAEYLSARKCCTQKAYSEL